jgi:glycosyltransferase involved in cell wall biosynthesis
MIAALIPAYRAEATLGPVARQALRHVDLLLVVDDGSPDGSGATALASGAQVVRHARNLGKGAALATGFTWLLKRGATSIVTLDADGQHDPEEIPLFVAAERETGADLVVGARIGAFAGMSGARRFGNRFSSAAVRLFRGPSLPDTQCGYRLYGRAFLEAAPIRGRSYDAEAELLMRAGIGGFRVVSIPIHVLAADGRATSHYRPWLDTLRICRAVIMSNLVETKRRNDRA